MRGFFNYIFVGMRSARGASSSTSATSTSTWSTSTSDFVFGVYCTTSTGLRLVGLRRLPCRHRLRLRHLLHRRRLDCGSRGFIVYLTDVDSSFVFINMYFVARDARDQGLRHNHRTRGASGIGMSGVTPKHEVLPGDRGRRGRGG
jgi:hypothetical protein